VFRQQAPANAWSLGTDDNCPLTLERQAEVFTSIEQLRRETYVWIDSWYNARRRHSAIGYLSPLDELFQGVLVVVGDQ
jgi:transposase InsO family protein